MTPCILSTGHPWGKHGMYRYDFWQAPDGHRYWGAHRVALARHLWATQGRGILPGHHSAHKCGTHACIVVGEGHIYEATPQQNESDKRLHGRTRRGGAKLTPEARRVIAATYRTSTATGMRTHARALAVQFGVRPRTIYDAATGRSWQTEDAR